jgi:predicted RNA-binding Zn ribbon-like protein
VARPPAPGDLELVRRFVNTRDPEAATDDIASPAGARRWLSDHGLIARSARLGPADLRRVVDVRESLRALLLANNGADLPDASLATLDRAARRAGLVVRFTGGAARLEPVATGADAAIGTLLGTVFTAMADGTWSRLKACRDDACQWAFYDHSKNRSGTWCSMDACGNRAKARVYRARVRRTG